MLFTPLKFLTNSTSLLKPLIVTHSLTVTRGRKLWMRPYLASLYKRRLDQGPEPDRPRSIWPNWNYNSEIYSFGKRLGEEFKRDTLKQAFIMSSYLDKQQEDRLKLGLTDENARVDLADNRKLTEIGENVAGTYINVFLRRCFPLLPPEGVSAITRYLMAEDLLVNIASNLGIRDLVQTAEFPVSPSTLCAVFKAVIGALHHDQGAQRSEKFVQDFILTQLIGKDLFEMWAVANPMGLLVETMCSQGLSEPEPRLLWSTGSETILSSYIVGIYVDRKLIGQAPGETVSIAEEMAARDALRKLWRFDQSCCKLPFDNKPGHTSSVNSRLNARTSLGQ